jgi:hypothetical protein
MSPSQRTAVIVETYVPRSYIACGDMKSCFARRSQQHAALHQLLQAPKNNSAQFRTASSGSV